ncbi:MAG: hypothetical protein NTY15_09535 [Planctomycetota bacterium]|nr:hypothetical protein [Planctomycetota bacterium]
MNFARRPVAYIARLRYVVGVILAILGSNDLFAQKQEKLEPVVVDIVLADDPAVPELGFMLRGVEIQQVNSKPQLLKQMRGLIQNELSIISDICGLELKQQQALADLAELEWKSKTNAYIVKRTQEHVYGTIDLDGLAERIVRLWLESVSTQEQLEKYDLELADRMKWRQRAVVSKVLDTLQAKLNLSGVQMDQIEIILNEKWKDRWYRSLEATFDNVSLLPEIRPSWIMPVLSESQRAALSTRDQQQRFGAQQASADSPSLALEERFRVGAAVSSDPTDVETAKDSSKPVDKEIEKPKTAKERSFDEKKP